MLFHVLHLHPLPPENTELTSLLSQMAGDPPKNTKDIQYLDTICNLFLQIQVIK